MDQFSKEIRINEYRLEFKNCIEMGIGVTPSLYSSIRDKNQTNTKYIQIPIAKHSLNELSNNFGIPNSTEVCRFSDGYKKHKAVLPGKYF